MNGYDPILKAPSLVFVANLYTTHISDYGYVVVGGENVENVNVLLTSKWVTYKMKFTAGTRSGLGSFFGGNKDKHPDAILILKNDPNGNIKILKLTETQASMKVSPAVLTILQQNVVDMVVFGRQVVADHCDVFESIHAGFVGKNYILREFDSTSKDYSINKWSSTSTPFIPEVFKLGMKTPGRDNDCSFANVILEENMVQLMA